jgi:surfactin synthase thioesterase subunit
MSGGAPALPLSVERMGCLRRLGGRRPWPRRLLCCPWSGAGASAFRFLAPLLPADVELYVLQLPGREERFNEAKLRRMHEVVAHALPDVMTLADSPLHLLGHSLGALVAYELALALRAQAGFEPDSLLVSGLSAPNVLAAASPSAWHRSSDAVFAAHISELGGTPRSIIESPAMLRALLPCIRADYELRETYEASSTLPLACPLLPCGGRGDRLLTPDGMAAWQRCSSAGQAPRWFDGDHFYLTAQPALFARALHEWLPVRQPASVALS